jgi:hypothetical protein
MQDDQLAGQSGSIEPNQQAAPRQIPGEPGFLNVNIGVPEPSWLNTPSDIPTPSFLKNGPLARQ